MYRNYLYLLFLLVCTNLIAQTQQGYVRTIGRSGKPGQPVSYHIISEDYGRDVTPSDHYPLLVCYRLLSEDQTLFPVANETELNDALLQATPGDTILLQTDSLALTEPIRPQCSVYLLGQPNGTILTLSKEGSMVDIPGSWSLVCENLIFKNASTTALQGGAAIYTKGYDLFLTNCQFINCHAPNSNGGAICATPHQAQLDSCLFFGNGAKNGGACYIVPYSTLQINDCRWQNNIATSTGGGLYAKFNGDCRLRRSVFDNNEAGAGAGLAAAAFDVLGVLNCSFSNNHSRQQGAAWLSSTNTSSKATVFQCTFLNNTLQMAGGLPTLIAKYGGVALKIQVPSSASAQTIGVAHCTFINNTTTSSTYSDKFTTAALDLEGGYVCLMNNLMLANRFQCTDYQGYNDLRTSGTINVWRNTYNLLTNDTKITDWKTTIASCIEGQWQDSLFVPTITDQFVYHLLSTSLGTTSICAIPLIQRMCSSALSYNLTGDGADGTYVRYDQVGNWRDKNACYGSIEYTTPTGWTRINDKPNSNRKVMYNGQIIIDNHYNIQGQTL